MAAGWFLTKDGQTKVGPFTFDQLKQLVASGSVLSSDKVLNDGSTQWVMAGTVPGLVTNLQPDQPAGVAATVAVSSPETASPALRSSVTGFEDRSGLGNLIARFESIKPYGEILAKAVFGGSIVVASCLFLSDFFPQWRIDNQGWRRFLQTVTIAGGTSLASAFRDFRSPIRRLLVYEKGIVQWTGSTSETCAWRDVTTIEHRRNGILLSVQSPTPTMIGILADYRDYDHLRALIENGYASNTDPSGPALG